MRMCCRKRYRFLRQLDLQRVVSCMKKMENSGFQCSSKQEVFISAVIVGTKKHKKCILEGFRKQVLSQE